VILGPGGSGKSTVLNYLYQSDCESLDFLAEKNAFDKTDIGYLKQHQKYQKNTFEEIFQESDLEINKVINSMWKSEEAKSLLSPYVGVELDAVPESVFKLLEFTWFVSTHSDKKILFLDEPEVNLNDNLTFLIEGIRQLEQTVVLVTHHMALATEVGDDLMYLRYGSIVEHLPKDEFLSSENEQVKYILKNGC